MTSHLRFDQFAEMIAERIEDPSSSGLERYVGLEHLDPEAIDIKRWGVPADVTSTKFRFYPGDVIYGRRRAYQRKAGLADFDGLASAHALVLRAVLGVCDPAYLAYMLVSESFTRVAVGISVGSLSPTINWRDLRLQEFDLPSLDEQHRVVEVMRAVDREIEAAERAEVAAVVSIAALVSSLPESVASRRPLSEVLALRSSGAWGDSDESKKRSVKVRVITNGDIRANGSISGFATRWFSPTEAARFALRPGDTLMAASGATIGKTSLIETGLISSAKEPLVFSNFVHLLRPSAQVSATYLYAQARYGTIQQDITRLSSGSTLANLNVDFYRRAAIQVPHDTDMGALEMSIASLIHTESAARGAMQAAGSLRTSLLQELIG
jgi:type I restriction enzyme S subunit